MLDGGGIAGIAQKSSTIANCYNVGVIESIFVEYAGIVGSTTKAQNNIYQNNFYLENIINGVANDKISIDGIYSVDNDELKNLSSILGIAFKEDTNKINNGYPILSWQ